MKIRLILPVLAFFMAGTISAAGADGIRKTESSEDREMDRFISALMRKMTLEEKVGQMVQIPANFTTGPAVRTGNYIKAIEEGRVGSMLNVEGVAATRKYQELAMKSRLRIPLIFGKDVIHGYRTGFPIPLAEASSFDMEVIERAARCAAREASAAGIHWTFAPMVDVGWDARWGRVMEGAGEDPFYGAAVARARVKGFQGEDLSDTATVLSCIKHFAGYGAVIAGKEYNSVDMSMGQFANFYMLPYKAGVEAGAATVMTAFNDFNSVPCTVNGDLLRGLLKDSWGFDGFTVSDYASLGEVVNHRCAVDRKDAARQGVMAGLDMEMSTGCYADFLVELVRDGSVPEKFVDDAVRRVLEQKYRLGLFEDPFRYCNEERERTVIGSAKSREDALYVAERSIVLLENENNFLPLSPDIRKVALVGPLSKSRYDMCGMWSCADQSRVVTLYDAMMERGVDVLYSDGYDLGTGELKDTSLTMSYARQADAVVVTIGERAENSGEMRCRGDISIAQEQQALVSMLAASGKPVVVLLMCGRPVIFNEAREAAASVLCTWWLGSESGNAICNVLWGDYNPSGKLPMTFPLHNGQIPLYYQQKSTGRPESSGWWHSRYQDIPNGPAYPFGYGLSYTTFEYSAPELLPGDGEDIHAKVKVCVRNTGKYAGEEVVQLYVRDDVASVTRPVKELKGFRKIALGPGEVAEVVFDITDSQLGFYDERLEYIVEPGRFTLMTGGDSVHLRSVDFTL